MLKYFTQDKYTGMDSNEMRKPPNSCKTTQAEVTKADVRCFFFHTLTIWRTYDKPVQSVATAVTEKRELMAKAIDDEAVEINVIVRKNIKNFETLSWKPRVVYNTQFNHNNYS